MLNPRRAPRSEPRVGLACPICRTALTERAQRFGCRTCRLDYPRAGGVAHLAPSFALNGAAPTFASPRLRQLVEEARNEGWTSAQRRFAGEVVSGALRPAASSRRARLQARLAGGTWEDVLQELVDPARAGWKFLLDLRPSSSAVLLGPASGATALSLARSVGHVLVLDGDRERLALTRLQAEDQGLEHLTYGQVADPLRLPLADGSVDLAVVPGLADWFAAVAPEWQLGGDVAAELLRELARVLVSGGQALVGVDNRRGVGRVLGGVGGGSPAHLAPAELRQAAAAAGYAGASLFAPFPRRRKFHQLLDLERRDRMNFCADPYRTRGRVLRPLVRVWDRLNRGGRAERWLYPHLPAFGAVLATGAGRPSFAERLLQQLVVDGALAAGGGPLRRYFVRARGVVVLVAGTPAEGAVVRLPLEPAAERSCRRHHEAIAALAADTRIPAAARGLFPAPLTEGQLDGQSFFVERALAGDSGRLYYARSARRYERAITAAADALGVLRRATEEPVRLDGGERARLYGDWLAELHGVVEESRRPVLDRLARLLEGTLGGAALPLGWHHGDYDFANLLYGPGDRLSGIIDFECFEARGLPLIDLVLLLARRSIRRRGLAFGQLFVETILPRALPRFEAELLAREERALGLDRSLYGALALCCWLNHTRLRRDSWLVRSRRWVDDNVRAVVAHLERIL